VPRSGDRNASVQKIDGQPRRSPRGQRRWEDFISQPRGGARWSTVGVSGNIIDASFQALVDAINYKLVKSGATAA
jgi:hypothetical protein